MREAVDLDPAPASVLELPRHGARRHAARWPRPRRPSARRSRATTARPQYAYNLGLILQREGRPAEARPLFEKALALDPRFTPARERLGEMGRRAGS